MATVYSAAGTAPVKVRDLSPGGALIEGGSLPSLGSLVRLSRGSLEVPGEVVWSSANRAGLKFDAAIRVQDWLPRTLARSPQQRTDEAVQAAKSMHYAKDEGPSGGTRRFDRMTAATIKNLRTALVSLAEDLAADPEIVERHLSKLQTLDLVVQALGSLADERREFVTAPGPGHHNLDR